MKSSIEEIQNLADATDILLLQETWLVDFELSILSSLHKDFYGKGVSAVDSTCALIGRPHGGVAILWRKALGNHCRIMDMNDKRLLGIEISNGESKLLVLNVYMPVCAEENKDEFLFYLTKIDSTISNYSSPYSLVFGDFNASLASETSSGNMFGKCLQKYCSEENLIISDMDHLPADSYTYISDAHGSTTWIDHLISTRNANSLVSQMNISYEYISSDHHPVSATVSLENLSTQTDSDSHGNYKQLSVRWENLKHEEILQYKLNSEVALSKVDLDHSLILCDDPHCSEMSHLNSIDRMYGATMEALMEASAELSCKPKNGYQQVPGWNSFCKELHSQARDSYLLWRDHGKQRHGFLFNNMKRTKAQFKRALRHCKKDA